MMDCESWFRWSVIGIDAIVGILLIAWVVTGGRHVKGLFDLQTFRDSLTRDDRDQIEYSRHR